MTEKPMRSDEWNEDEVEKLLRLAEEIQEEREGEVSRIERYKLMQYLSIGVFILLALIFWATSSSLDSGLLPPYTFPIVIVIFGAFYIALIQRQIDRVRRRLHVSNQSLYEIVQILRETEGMILKGLSPFEQAQFRIRLARFGIGPDDTRARF
jgi:hypothetical protein